MSNPNFLILDEPTNDLDIFAMSVLEDYLRNFQGCLIVVSHDRYFMDKMVDHLFVFEGEGVIKDIVGNYTDFRKKQIQDKRDEKNGISQVKIEKVVAGGSVANTMAGIAYLNGSPSFIGKVNSDKFGDLYKKSLEDINVNFPYIKKMNLCQQGHLLF